MSALISCSATAKMKGVKTELCPIPEEPAYQRVLITDSVTDRYLKILDNITLNEAYIKKLIISIRCLKGEPQEVVEDKK